jgi:hypothetical protein
MNLTQFIASGKTIDYSIGSTEPLLGDREFVTALQQALLNALYDIPVDGFFGRLTRDSLNHFKEKNFLGQLNSLGPSTLQKLIGNQNNNISSFKYVYPAIIIGNRSFVVTIPPGVNQKALGAPEYQRAASEFGLEVATVRAVVEVEASGSGFLLNEVKPSRPKILFEAHIFYKETPKPVSRSRPDLSSPKWNRTLYKGGSAEWGRLLDAMSFDPIPALKSASWGLGQVMGFNHKLAGCATVEQMVVEAHQGEFEQLRHMLNFCKNNNLIRHLQQRNWAAFALGYNGSGYKANKYDEKLANSYRSWKQRIG